MLIAGRGGGQRPKPTQWTCCYLVSTSYVLSKMHLCHRDCTKTATSVVLLYWPLSLYFDPCTLRKFLHLCNSPLCPHAFLFWSRQHPPLITCPKITIYPPTYSLSIYIFLSLYPKILASPHLLVYWRPATLSSWSLTIYYLSLLTLIFLSHICTFLEINK